LPTSGPRSQAADRAAVPFLDATHQSSKGLLTTLERFSNDALFQTTQIDPYVQTHPLPAERISNLQQLARRAHTMTPTIRLLSKRAMILCERSSSAFSAT
jgi:predicted Zn-dependent protease